MRNLLLQIVVILFICGCLFMINRLWRAVHQGEEALKTQTISTLEYEFGKGKLSLDFMDRARQLGARNILITTQSSDNLGVPCNNSIDFNKLNVKYKTQLDGSAQAQFIDVPHPYSFQIYFKDGKVIRIQIKDMHFTE